MLYESQYSLYSDLVKFIHGRDLSFPLHIHSSFEYITVKTGEMTVTVDDKEYTLSDGDSLLIFPNQPHSFLTPVSSTHFICIFSPHVVRSFTEICKNRLPTENSFKFDAFYRERLLSMTDINDILSVKALLYSVCAEFHKSAHYSEKSAERSELLFRIFTFVSENYQGDCSLSALSHSTGYNSVYLSRFFAEKTGFTFSDYTARYRINEACYALKSTDKKILDISLECGFESLRSFNRSFKRIMSISPSEYRYTK